MSALAQAVTVEMVFPAEMAVMVRFKTKPFKDLSFVDKTEMQDATYFFLKFKIV